MSLVRMSGMNRGDCLLATFVFQLLLRSATAARGHVPDLGGDIVETSGRPEVR